jgi:hypothetical protein
MRLLTGSRIAIAALASPVNLQPNSPVRVSSSRPGRDPRLLANLDVNRARIVGI